MTFEQMRLFDGNPIERFGVRFGGYDLDDEDVESFRDGEVLVVVMVASVEGATIKPLPTGDRKRINNLRVHNMRVAKGEMRDNLVEVFHLVSDEDQLPLDMALPTSLIPPRVDPSTGEIDEDEPEPEPEPFTESARPAPPGSPAYAHDPALAAFLGETG